MDYKELVEMLRDAEGNSELDCEIHELRPVLLRASNCIESLQAELERVKAERNQYKAALQNWHEDSGWGDK